MVVDILLTILSFAIAYYIRKNLLPDTIRELTTTTGYFTIIFLIVIFWYCAFFYTGVHKISHRTSYSGIIYNLMKAIIIGMLMLAFALYVFKITDISRLLMFIFYIANFITLTLYKVLLIKWLRKWNREGHNQTNLLLLGCNETTLEITNRIIDQHSGEYRILGCLHSVDSLENGIDGNGLKKLGSIEALEKTLKEHVIDEIIISPTTTRDENFEQCLSLCENTGAVIRILPDWGISESVLQPKIGTTKLDYFCDLPTLSIYSTPKESDMILLKYFLDYLLAVIILIINLPTFLIIFIAIKATSKGPIFYTQERIGLHGRKFNMYKFRTMVENADEKKEEFAELNESDGPAFKIKRDPRIIPGIGTLLRKTNLDELPQLINVLKGEMSLVGPRPPLQCEVDQYDFWQRRRLSMKPGITCIWQILPNRNEVAFTDWMKKDLEYIDTWSMLLDFKILIGTFVAVLRADGR